MNDRKLNHILSIFKEYSDRIQSEIQGIGEKEYTSVSFTSKLLFEDLIACINIFPRLVIVNNSYKQASFGRLVELNTDDKNRFNAQKIRMREVFSSFKHSGDAFFIGGYSFNKGEDDIWRHFSASKFVMGKIQIKEENDTLRIIFNIHKNEDSAELIDYISDHLDFRGYVNFDIESDFVNKLSREKWISNINQCLHKIDHTELEKVVMARAIELRDKNLPLLNLSIFDYLSKHYGGSYIYHLEFEPGSYFVGATPELLVSISEGIVSTVALAGSIARDEDETKDALNANTLLSDKKELEEHKIVVDQILHRMSIYSDDIYAENQPSIIKLQNIQHLKTKISGKLNSEYNIHQIVSDLHPTPAVGGKPRSKALQLIETLEVYRGWYASPIGLVNNNMEGMFIVGLRSAIISGDTMRLYAGAGIVAASDPLKEWNETCMKFKPIKEAINNE